MERTVCPLVSAVVPTRNRADLLPGLLDALDRQDYGRYEVIVVDDGSTDATADILSGWTREGRVALRLDKPSGSYAARNRGWRAAQGQIIAFTDDDCLPQRGWLSALVEALDADRTVGAQGVTLARPGDITPFTHQIEQREPGTPYRTCNIAYLRSILERLGGFDDSLRWYADNIFGLRAVRLGPIAFATDAVVLHPPRPREWRDRDQWLARFAADRRHRQELHRLGAERVAVPGGALPLVLWVLRPLVRQSGAHLWYLMRHPVAYFRQVSPMIKEKRELLMAMREFWLEGEWDKGGEGGEALTPELGLPAGYSDAALQRRRPTGAAAEPTLISVVVVTRDRPEFLQGVLGALQRQTWEAREVIVVDHGGRERTRAIAEASGARYVAAPGVTLAAARQAGVNAARGAIVAFTDDDCLPAPGWLEAIADAFYRDPSLQGVQGRTEAEVGPIGHHAVGVSHGNQLYQTCNIAYRREVLRDSGGFDLRFVGWFEDTALGARVRAHGPIGFEPTAVVIHRAVPRRRLDRAAWRTLLDDERQLARSYPDFYRSTRGPSFLVTVVSRWLLGSPLKTLLRELPRARGDPGVYLRLVRELAAERRELVRLLLEREGGEDSNTGSNGKQS